MLCSGFASRFRARPRPCLPPQEVGGQKQTRPPTWAASISPNGHFSFVPENDRLVLARTQMSAAPVSSQPPSPETGVFFTADRGRSVRAKMGHLHESSRIVAIGSRPSPHRHQSLFELAEGLLLRRQSGYAWLAAHGACERRFSFDDSAFIDMNICKYC